MKKNEKNCHNCYNAKFGHDNHGNKYGTECMRTGMCFFASIHRGCKIAITDEDVEAARNEVEVSKEVFKITLEAYKKKADCYIAEWEAIMQRLVPEERSGMDKLAEYLLTPRCKKQGKPISADELKNSSAYKCALLEERIAMLERHYELELAGLQEKISMLEKANILLSVSDDQSRRELGKVAKALSGKWRLLEIGEQPQKGDQAFLLDNSNVRVWVEPDGFKGVPKEGSIPIRRKITL